MATGRPSAEVLAGCPPTWLRFPGEAGAGVHVGLEGGAGYIALVWTIAAGCAAPTSPPQTPWMHLAAG
ncbi:hypothetical protein GCM10023170_036330 [Phytohabitans houttuyneae]|uniref:Uncharacterized protein n=1 Tax=Phytohabitans houttuyneae TaxID=1076126 RepID=A0A6V8KQ19_9ACTN|nr:hypothetical protein Phou_088780 [Phytohabitans houttuyneae]